VLSITQAAKELGVAPKTLRQWERERRIPFVVERTEGGHRRYRPEQIAQLRERIVAANGTLPVLPRSRFVTPEYTRKALRWLAESSDWIGSKAWSEIAYGNRDQLTRSQLWTDVRPERRVLQLRERWSRPLDLLTAAQRDAYDACVREITGAEQWLGTWKERARERLSFYAAYRELQQAACEAHRPYHLVPTSGMADRAALGQDWPDPGPRLDEAYVWERWGRQAALAQLEAIERVLLGLDYQEINERIERETVGMDDDQASIHALAIWSEHDEAMQLRDWLRGQKASDEEDRTPLLQGIATLRQRIHHGERLAYLQLEWEPSETEGPRKYLNLSLAPVAEALTLTGQSQEHQQRMQQLAAADERCRQALITWGRMHRGLYGPPVPSPFDDFPFLGEKRACAAADVPPSLASHNVHEHERHVFMGTYDSGIAVKAPEQLAACMAPLLLSSGEPAVAHVWDAADVLGVEQARVWVDQLTVDDLLISLSDREDQTKQLVEALQRMQDDPELAFTVSSWREQHDQIISALRELLSAPGLALTSRVQELMDERRDLLQAWAAERGIDIS
jgi:hypothetical protein